MSDAPERIWADDAGGWWRLESDENPGALIEYVRADEHDRLMAEKDAEIARLKAERDEAQRRRDEWRAKAEGYDAVRLALREKVGTPWPPHMSRLLWAGIAADEKKRADDAASEVARLRAALLSGMEDARNNALEDAAKVVEDYLMDRRLQNLKAKLADAIRALKDRNETEPEREPDNRTDNPDNRLDGEREET